MTYKTYLFLTAEMAGCKSEKVSLAHEDSESSRLRFLDPLVEYPNSQDMHFQKHTHTYTFTHVQTHLKL